MILSVSFIIYTGCATSHKISYFVTCFYPHSDFGFYSKEITFVCLKNSLRISNTKMAQTFIDIQSYAVTTNWKLFLFSRSCSSLIRNQEEWLFCFNNSQLCAHATTLINTKCGRHFYTSNTQFALPTSPFGQRCVWIGQYETDWEDVLEEFVKV